VFCRNVLIYFAPEHSRSFLTRVADQMPAATLFLGGAETVWSVTDQFEAVRATDCYYYRSRAASPLRPRVDHGGARPTAAPDISTGTRAVLDRPPAPAGRARRATRAPTAAAQAGPLLPAVDPREPPELTDVAVIARAGQQALEAGNHQRAVVAFRKWVYLQPGDALAHLHLGLAFEVSGDEMSARRSFAAARQLLVQNPDASPSHRIGGFAVAELLNLLDSKTGGFPR